MVAQFKINERVILTDSGGTRNLFVDGAITFNDSDGKTLTLRNTKKTLTQDFFTNYFHGFQGETSGYTSGGSVSPPFSGSRKNTIDKFPFSSDTNASDVGDLTQARTSAGGQSSIANGYSSGGAKDPGGSDVNIIDKFPFAVDGNATDVGDLLAAISSVGGQSSPSNGYTTGGEYSNVIQKFPFSVDANSSDVGDLTVTRKGFGGHSSLINGYNSGGEIESGPALSNVIDKFPFAVDGNATDVGDLTQSRVSMGSQSSSTHGYKSGGKIQAPPAGGGFGDTIDKFSFASDGNATDVGEMTASINGGAGQSSKTHGYISGGATKPPYTPSNIIQKFPFSSDTNASDVGDLTQSRAFSSGGQQV